MAGERIITCTNADGASITFDEKGFKPFLLAKASGIYDVTNSVFVSNNTMIDGAEYQGSIMQAKNIVLTLKDINNFAENRDIIDVVFEKGSLGVLTATGDGHERQIEYYVESITSTATPKVRLTTISLICPNPYFYDTFDSRVYISNTMPGFEWAHNFLEEGEEFSYINEERIKTIVNSTAEDDVGLTIMLSTTGSVTNPSITKIETNERIKIGDDNYPFTLRAEEPLIITTTTGSKNIYTLSGTTKTDVNQYLTDDSVFFQLTRGENTFGYNADANADYMTVTMTYRYKYQRA